MEKIKKIKDDAKLQEEHIFTESFLLSIYSGEFNVNDKMFNKILDLLKERCDENNIEYRVDVHSAANAVLKTLVNEVNKENNVNISFSDIDKFEDEYINNVNNIIDLPCDKRIIQFDSITNVDFMHNPTTSIVELFRHYVSSKLSVLINDVFQLYENGILIQNEDVVNSFNPFSDISDGEIVLSEDTKEFYKSELEFFMLLPELSKIFKTRRKYKKQVDEMRKNLLIDLELKSNSEYVVQLSDLVNHDKSIFTYYYHGADSVETASKIMREGLFMQYGDIDRTAKSELDVSGIINYSYGFERVGRRAIVVIAVPNGEQVVKYNKNNSIELVGTGQGQAGIGTFMPRYVIPSEYIVGYVDKINKKVIYNDCFGKDKTISHDL